MHAAVLLPDCVPLECSLGLVAFSLVRLSLFNLGETSALSSPATTADRATAGLSSSLVLLNDTIEIIQRRMLRDRDTLCFIVGAARCRSRSSQGRVKLLLP